MWRLRNLHVGVWETKYVRTRLRNDSCNALEETNAGRTTAVCTQ